MIHSHCLLGTTAIRGVAVFGQQAAGTDFEAVAPLIPTGRGGFLLPFDNKEGMASAVALVNTTASQSSTAALIFRDEAGSQILARSIELPARGQEAFLLTDRYPELADRRGVVDVSSPGSDFSVLVCALIPAGHLLPYPC